MSTAEELFPTIGQVANQTDQIKPDKTQAADDEEKAVTEIPSLCMECHEQVRYFKLKCTAFTWIDWQGTTRMLLTSIPFFREIVVMSFRCGSCGTQNNEIQAAAAIQRSYSISFDLLFLILKYFVSWGGDLHLSYPRSARPGSSASTICHMRNYYCRTGTYASTYVSWTINDGRRSHTRYHLRPEHWSAPPADRGSRKLPSDWKRYKQIERYSRWRQQQKFRIHEGKGCTNAVSVHYYTGRSRRKQFHRIYRKHGRPQME